MVIYQSVLILKINLDIGDNNQLGTIATCGEGR